MNVATTLRNFHVPLPDEIYLELRAEAERIKQPATLLARMAIEAWLEQRRAAALYAEIAAYAERHAGTNLDLDQEIEAAGLELLGEESKKPAARKSRKKRSK
jgi:hypothetical protein